MPGDTLLAFLSEPRPAYGTIETVTPGVRRVVAPNPGPMTYHGTNTWLVDGDDGLIVIDPGPDDAAHVAAVASAGRVRIGRLAEDIGVSRRYLEIGFRRQIGVPPKTVARVARFQHAVDVLSRPSATFGAAVACGYADQSHFNREFRAMAGITPTQLCAFLQYVRPLAD